MQWDIQGAEGLNPQSREEIDHMVSLLVGLDDALVMLERDDGAFVQLVLRDGVTVAINVGEGRHKTMRQLRGKRLSHAEIVTLLDAFGREDPAWKSVLSDSATVKSPATPQAGGGVQTVWVVGAVAVLVVLTVLYSLS